MYDETETPYARAMRLFGGENLNEAIDSAEREMADLRASLKQAVTAYEGRCNMLTERCAAAEKEAEFQRTRANELAGDRDRASAFAARLQDMLAKTQKDFADVTACLAEMSDGRVTHYDFMRRGRAEDHVQQLLAVIRGGAKQDKAERHAALDQAEAKVAELRQAVREAADFLGVLARVHEVFDNLQPGCAGRLGGAWRLYEAGWRADQTVEEAHRLLGRRMGERMAHPDPIVCALIEATKSQWTGQDAVKALAPLVLATCPAPDEALVANLERAMADRDSYREALLAAGMDADEPEPIKWAMTRALERSDNEAIVRMLGITAREAGPAMEPDPVATLVELFQSSMPPDFMFGANRENPTAVVWSWRTDVCGLGFATPLLALEDAWIRYCALEEAQARKEAAHVVDTIERVAKEHGVEFDRTDDVSAARAVVALGEKLKGNQHTGCARSAVLEAALRTVGMPDGCKSPGRWADVHLDGWKTMQSSLASLGVNLYEVSGSDVANLMELELMCDERCERMGAPVLARTSQHPELGQMVTVTLPKRFGRARGAQDSVNDTVDKLIGDTWDLQGMGGTRAGAVKWWETLACRWVDISAVLGIPVSKDPPIAIEHFVSGYSDNIRKAIRERSSGVSLGQVLAGMAADIAKARGALRKLGMPEDCKDSEAWAVSPEYIGETCMRYEASGGDDETRPVHIDTTGVDLAKDGASDSTVVAASDGVGGWKVEGPIPAKAPGWTGITWTSRKGKPKSVSIPGMVLASGIVEGTSGPFTAVNIPDGVARLPMNLLRRVRSGGLLTFHMGDLKRTGTIAWQSGVDRAIRFDRLRIEIAES